MTNNAVMLKTGSHVMWQKEHAEIIHASTEVFLLRFKNGKFQNFKPQEIHDAYFNSSLTLVEAVEHPIIFRNVSKKEDIEKIERITAFLHELDQRQFPCSKATREDVIRVVSPIHGAMSPSTLYRLYDTWTKAGKSFSVFSSKYRKKRDSKFADEMLDLLEEVLHDKYLTRECLTLNECYEDLKKLYDNREMKCTCVSRSQFYEIANTLDEIEVTLARKGREAARIKSQFTKEKIWADFPLQYVEIDALHLNLGIVDEEDRTFLGTLIIYLAIDRFSRCIVGFSTSIKGEKGETTEAVIECIRNSILIKKQLTNCRNTWDAFGVPHFFICDAGTAFHNIHTVSYMLNVGASRIVTQVRTPKKKPFIERLNRTVRSQFAKKIPGYLPNRMSGEIAEDTIEKLACVTEREVREILQEYICDYYHQSSHRGLDNQTPAEVWKNYYEKSGMPPRLPPNPELLNSFVGVSFHRALHPVHGISINSQSYNSDELKDLYYSLMQKGLLKDKKIHGIENKKDISKIFVVHPETMEMIMVSNRDKRIAPGTTLIEQNARRKPSKKRYMPGDSAVLQNAKARQKAKRAKKSCSKPTTSDQPITPPQTVDDLNKMIMAGKIRNGQKIDVPSDSPSNDFFVDFGSLEPVECK